MRNVLNHPSGVSVTLDDESADKAVVSFEGGVADLNWAMVTGCVWSDHHTMLVMPYEGIMWLDSDEVNRAILAMFG